PMATVGCPSCGQQLKVPDEVGGRKVRCSKCASTFVAETANSNGSAPPPPPPAPSRSGRDRERYEDDDDDDDDRRERSRRRGAPHRGGMIMAFGITSLVLFFMSIGALAGVGPFGAPVSIIGLILGILGWIWGSADLKKMKAGEMDRRGQSNTNAGYICGIIGTALNGLGMLCTCGVVLVAIGMVAMFASAAKMAPPPTTGPTQPAPIRPRRIFAPAPRLSNYLPDRIDL